MNVSEQLLNILISEGVKHIFGVAGDALNPLVIAIGKRDDIRWIRMNHEGNASFAAFAQGELSKNPGVCASTVGPGALHLINGLYNAKKARTPVLAITGQIPIEHLGTNYQQEVDLKKIFDDICEYQAIIRAPEEAPQMILRAVRTAVNHKTVCRIELPADVAEMKASNENFIHKVFRSESLTVPSKEKLNEAARLINGANKIGILAGEGCREAREETLNFSQKIKAPITHSLKASDIFDHDTKNVVGQTGMIGNSSGYKGVMTGDLLIMLGTDFPYTDFLPDETKTIQIDLRAENIGNRTPVDIGLQGNINATLRLLDPLCEEKADSEFLTELRKEFDSWKETMEKEADSERNMEPLHPQIFSKRISDVASDDAIFVIDTGAAVIWASNYMSFHFDRRVIGSFNHGSMGVGLPAAIGAQLQYPGREVWALVGDGAFNMTLHDFITAVKYELPVKVVVFNNDQLGFVKIEMEEAGYAPNLETLHVENFNFVEFARICGAEGRKVEHSDDVRDAIDQAKNSNKPFIIDASVTNGELSFPPKIKTEQAFNFGKSKVREIVKAMGGNRKQWQNIKSEIDAYFD